MPLPLPDLDSLRCFEAAARTLNFRTAARAVALSPAAFGQRIRKLEEQLGIRLFERTSRKIELTEAGERLVEPARAALEAAATCHLVASGERVAPMRLLLGTRFELGMSWLVPLLPNLETRLPTIQLDLYFGSNDDLLSRVRGSSIDATVSSSRLPDAALVGQILHEEQYTFVAAPQLLAERPFGRREHARQHVLLDIDAGLPLYRYLRDAPGQRGQLEFREHRYLGAGAAIHTLLLQGRGVAVMPDYMVRQDLDAGRLTPLLPRTPLLSDHFKLIHRAEDPRRTAYERLAAELRQHPIS